MKYFGNHKGFTLIEFVVIISIFAIMAGVALVNFAGFRSNVGLKNLAHDIALTIRQAQVFGWSTQTDVVDDIVQISDSGSGNPTRYAHGVYIGYTNGAYDNQITLYTKNDPTPGAEYYLDTFDTVADKILIQGVKGVTAIRYAETKDMLLLDASNTIPQSGGPVEALSVAFSRPHPEAFFFSNTIPLNGPDSNFVGIYISAETDAPGQAQQVIIISRFGEISVQ